MGEPTDTELMTVLKAIIEDKWVKEHSATQPIPTITPIELVGDDNFDVAVDATYFLRVVLQNYPSHEPLLPALGGLMGIQFQIETELDNWKEHKMKPHFIFDGQSVTGQDEVSLAKGLRANIETNKAWDLYFGGEAMAAVAAFGASCDAFRIQDLYLLLQGILKKRSIGFWVAPQNAAAQIAYMDKTGVVNGIMGSQELLLYPIQDTVIRSIDWENKQISYISKSSLLHVKGLNVTPTMFVDALLMTGTSFLPAFPPLLKDPAVAPGHPHTIQDAVNILRTTDKSVAAACTSWEDVLKQQDPDWLDKYQKARMAVDHFMYIENDTWEVKVELFDTLTGDNHEYLGLCLPQELYHYLNKGLTSGRLLSWITHKKIIVQPTLDGFASDEYRKLVTSQLVPTIETALGLIIPRLHRGIQHVSIEMKVWFDPQFSHTVTNHLNLKPNPGQQASTWDVKEEVVKKHSLSSQPGSVAFEILTLQNPTVAKATVSKSNAPTFRQKGIDSPELITSVATWRFLHHRGYISDTHELTAWGKALAMAITELEPTVTKHSNVPGLYESLLLAFELIRYDLLNAKNQHVELQGMPMAGTEDDRDNLLLISRSAVLLRLRHEENGYTGPLSKNLLAFSSQVTAVREADRELVEASVISMFVWGQCKRQRDDFLEISQQLPFSNRNHNIAMGIAVKTWLDEDTTGTREERLKTFQKHFVPFATHLREDLDIFGSFFSALAKGVEAHTEMLSGDKAGWSKAAAYLKTRI